MVVHVLKRADFPRPEAIVPQVAETDRVYAIGDVHGRYDLLIRILKRIDEDARRFTDGRRVRLVLLGDYVDRGEDSKNVLDALSVLAKDGAENLILLRGNHEAVLLDFLEDPVGAASWLEFGGLQTLASFGVAVPRSWSDERRLIAARDGLARAIRPYMPLLLRMRDWWRCGDVLFCHAGLDPARALGDQQSSAFLWGHPEFLVDQPIAGLRVVHGHFDVSEPTSLPGRICIDTGAYYSGVLTAVRLDFGEAFLSSSEARTLAPPGEFSESSGSRG